MSIRYILLFAVFCSSVSIAGDDSNEKSDSDAVQIIDITRSISPSSPCVTKNYAPDIHDIEISNSKLLNQNCYPHMISTPSFAGTCITAPSFFDGNWKNVGNIKLKELVTTCYIVDLSQFMSAGGEITLDYIRDFEKQNKPIPEKSFVIIYTGWSQNWSNGSKKYINGYPTLTKAAAEYLIDKDIVGIGMDTPLPDEKSDDFEVQDLIYSKGLYLVKNLSDKLSMVSNNVGQIIIAPLKFENCNEAPARVFFMPDDSKKSWWKSLFSKND